MGDTIVLFTEYPYSRKAGVLQDFQLMEMENLQ